MSVSIRQLAEHCGVSIGTIDRVIHNRRGVSTETREKVERAIKELRYEPNQLAKSLSVGRSMSIGVVLLHLNNLFFAQMSDSIVKEADAQGYFTYLTLSEKDVEKEKNCIHNLVSRRADGIILFSTNKQGDFLRYLKSCSVPIVTVMTELPGFAGIRINDFQAMADATRYIVTKQYQRVVYVSTPLSYKDTMNIRVQENRRNGFLDVIRHTNLDYRIIDHSDYLSEIDRLNFKDVRTAFLCSSDIYALSILSHLRLRGMLPPYDYGLMGFDNIEILRHVEPAVTTVAVPIEEIGRRAVQTLVAHLNGGELETKILPHSIVPGQTIL